LPLEQRGLSFYDQKVGPVTQLLALFHEVLRRLPHRPRPESYFRGQHRATEEMGANLLGQVASTMRTHVRAAAAQHICAQLREAIFPVAENAIRDDVIRAVDEDQRPLFWCQH